MSRATRRHASGMYLGTELGMEEQIANLRILGEGKVASSLTWGSLLVALAGLGWFLVAEHQTEEVFALFLTGCGALVGVVSALALPHVRRAATATHRGRRESAMLLLPPYDDDDDGQPAGQILLRSGARWQMHFVRPMGWQLPQHDRVVEIPVEAVFLSDIPWPVLLFAGRGLLYPASRPVRGTRQ